MDVEEPVVQPAQHAGGQASSSSAQIDEVSMADARKRERDSSSLQGRSSETAGIQDGDMPESRRPRHPGPRGHLPLFFPTTPRKGNPNSKLHPSLGEPQPIIKREETVHRRS